MPSVAPGQGQICVLKLAACWTHTPGLQRENITFRDRFGLFPKDQGTIKTISDFRKVHVLRPPGYTINTHTVRPSPERASSMLTQPRPWMMFDTEKAIRYRPQDQYANRTVFFLWVFI